MVQSVQHSLVVLGVCLMAFVVFALFKRGKARQCYLFSVYMTLATSFTFLILAFPEHYSPEAYMVKQGIYDSLIFGMSLELSVRTFAAFTGIANLVRAVLSLAVVLSTVGIFLATPVNALYETTISVQPGVTTAGIWCLAFVGLLIVWYQIPVPAFTRAIIVGFVPYLVVFTIYSDLIIRLGWGVVHELGILNAVSYDFLAGYWAYAAWRKD